MNVPNKTPSIILQEATRVYKRMNNPKRMNKVEVSPIEPGMDPKKASVQEYCA